MDTPYRGQPAIGPHHAPPLPTPEPGDTWQHANGTRYTVVGVTNTAHRSTHHTPEVVYIGGNGALWSRSLSRWHERMVLVYRAPGARQKAEKCINLYTLNGDAAPIIGALREFAARIEGTPETPR